MTEQGLSVDLDEILKDPNDNSPTRRIYANRTLDMSEVEVIGFDMDYTLAAYHQKEMDRLALTTTLEKLVLKKGYPEALRQVNLDQNFIIRGLVVDKVHGNIFKMDAHRQVGRCYHGYSQLTAETRLELYGSRPISLGTDRYHWVDTLFSLPEATLLAGIIEHYEGGGTQLPWTYPELFDDIRECIDEAHSDNSLKAEILADLPKYIVKDPDLGPTLHRLRSVGKRIFLLTNSEHYYTEAVMTYLLGDALPFYRSWSDYFDLVIVEGRKPNFFTKKEPFILLDIEGQPVGVAADLKHSAIYQGGNLHTLEEHLGRSGKEILYVGDHMYADILRSRKTASWSTALVVQEMEDNIRLTQGYMADLQRINDLSESARRLDDGINYNLTLMKSLARMQKLMGGLTGPEMDVLSRTSEEARQDLDGKRTLQQQLLEELEELEHSIDRVFNPYWGRLFREGSERSLFGAQVQNFAGIYTSRVANFLAYSPNQVFRAPRERMPHERI